MQFKGGKHDNREVAGCNAVPNIRQKISVVVCVGVSKKRDGINDAGKSSEYAQM